jgi:hypothetical protein
VLTGRNHHDGEIETILMVPYRLIVPRAKRVSLSSVFGNCLDDIPLLEFGSRSVSASANHIVPMLVSTIPSAEKEKRRTAPAGSRPELA